MDVSYINLLNRMSAAQPAGAKRGGAVLDGAAEHVARDRCLGGAQRLHNFAVGPKARMATPIYTQTFKYYYITIHIDL